MSKIRIIIVEDEFIIAASLECILKNMGYEVCGKFTSGEETIKNFMQIKPDLALLDINLEGNMDGIETGQWIKNRLDIPIIYTTGYPDQDLRNRANLTKPAGYFLKPVNNTLLKQTIDSSVIKNN